MAYDNSSRATAARRTRDRVLVAAREAFLERGYAATTIRSVAAAAGVSAETVYKTYGGKAGLLKRLWDVTIAGDEDAAPIAAREHVRALIEAPDPPRAATAWADMAVALGRRVEPLLALLLPVRDSDPQLREFAATVDAERLVGATRTAELWAGHGWLRPHLTVPRARDQLWALNSPEVLGLFRRRGWEFPPYRDWLAGTVLATVLDPAGPPVTAAP